MQSQDRRNDGGVSLICNTFAAVKSPPFTDLCVNGRVPALEDPNTGIALWESGAILEYPVETYDTSSPQQQRLSFPRGTPEYFLAK
ncbi:glutathione S-transferase [Beauveria brongniartii RCEF 3172]|uniref:Glutathione S-transferase n=1 Tax=Beauveria brongniartii RCEF 3172 TaxID=1081107 RepID=A0A167JX36_9HYPO|nr:glutathione S-transferase [Beauveria brongniartii RCEF 3172]